MFPKAWPERTTIQVRTKSLNVKADEIVSDTQILNQTEFWSDLPFNKLDHIT